jgi:hypothetical protein
MIFHTMEQIPSLSRLNPQSLSSISERPMSLAYEIVGVVFALLNLMSAYGKLARTEQFVDIMPTIGVPLRALPYLAACQIAGAVGLVIGIWWAPLGIAAAVGFVAYFLGALAAHLRKSDFKNLRGALLMFVLAVAVLTLRILAA